MGNDKASPWSTADECDSHYGLLEEPDLPSTPSSEPDAEGVEQSVCGGWGGGSCRKAHFQEKMSKREAWATVQFLLPNSPIS